MAARVEMTPKTQYRVQLGVGVAWLLLGVWFGLATNIWVGIGFVCLGVYQVVHTVRRGRLTDQAAAHGAP